MTGERERQLRELEERLGHRFADLSLLDRALTHASRAHEVQHALCNGLGFGGVNAALVVSKLPA